MNRRDFFIHAGVIASANFGFLFEPKLAFAGLSGTISWGGIYLLEDKPDFMPFTRKALQLSGNESPSGESANKTLLNEIRSTDWTDTDIDLRAGLKKRVTRYGMVFGLATEQILASIHLPQIAATQYILRQIGYVIVYDIIDRRIVSCIAVRGRYLDEQPGVPNDRILPTLFFNLLAQKNQQGSIANFMLKKIKNYPFEEKYQGLYFQIQEVHFSKIAILHAEQIGVDRDRYADDIGFAATTAFSEVLQCPLVPYRKVTAVNRNMMSEMKIVSTSGESPLNTSLPLKPADCGIDIIHEGWEFQTTKTSDVRNQVALVTRVRISMYDKKSGNTFFNQSYYGRQDFNEMPQAGLSINRLSRLFMMHETLLDSAFKGIKSEESRVAIYDGIETIVPAQKTFIQADAQNWDNFDSECKKVFAALPRKFGD